MTQIVHAILFKLNLRTGHIPVKTYAVDSLHMVRRESFRTAWDAPGCH